MFDLISIGSISVDLFFQSDSLTFKDNRFQLAVGGKYVADQFQIEVGGGGANVAIGTAKLHLKTALMGTVGNTIYKSLIIGKLKNENIEYEYCDFVDNYYNLSAILLTKKGDRSIVHYVTRDQKLFDHNISVKYLTNTRCVYLGNLPDISIEERIKLLSFAKKNEILTIVNLGVIDARRSKSETKKLLNVTDIVIVNGHEFAELVRCPYKDIHFHEDVISWYINYLKDQLVVITEGEKGSFAYFSGNIYHQTAVKPMNIIDTTGAGDGYTAGFIAEYLQSKNIEKSMLSGAKYAAKILEKIGAN